MTDDEFKGFQAYQAECLAKAMERFKRLKAIPALYYAEPTLGKSQKLFREAVDFALWESEL